MRFAAISRAAAEQTTRRSGRVGRERNAVRGATAVGRQGDKRVVKIAKVAYLKTGAVGSGRPGTKEGSPLNSRARGRLRCLSAAGEGRSCRHRRVREGAPSSPISLGRITVCRGSAQQKHRGRGPV